jgi:glycosyltransferase involved in cell wall biosynthesis
MVKPGERNITIAIYSHPGFYPPLLNAIDELATTFTTVQVISRNLNAGHWRYPEEVKSFTSGAFKLIQDSEEAPTWWKIFSFLRFAMAFYKILRREKQQWVMCNDPIALFSMRLIRPFLRYPVRLWYHSHDISEPDGMRKFSIGYFAVRSEKKYFNRIELFTLPSESRVAYYPMSRLKGSWKVVPNYPPVRPSCPGPAVGWKEGTDLKLLYQGRLSDEHGLEEIIEFVKSDPSLRLTLVGPGSKSYIRMLESKIAHTGAEDRISVLKPVSYADLLKITLDHHVGLAVNKPVNALYSTAATASNKIYEYAACGLPIIYFHDEHYIQALKEYRWAFPTNLSFASLYGILQSIRNDYQSLSAAAWSDFRHKLNFTFVFQPVLAYLSESLQSIDR